MCLESVAIRAATAEPFEMESMKELRADNAVSHRCPKPAIPLTRRALAELVFDPVDDSMVPKTSGLLIQRRYNHGIDVPMSEGTSYNDRDNSTMT